MTERTTSQLDGPPVVDLTDAVGFMVLRLTDGGSTIAAEVSVREGIDPETIAEVLRSTADTFTDADAVELLDRNVQLGRDLELARAVARASFVVRSAAAKARAAVERGADPAAVSMLIDNGLAAAGEYAAAEALYLARFPTDAVT